MNVLVRFEGPDFYCPDCGRWLARANPNGTFDLAGKAAIDARIRVGVEELAAPPDDLLVLIIEAECHLWRCRVRRWWRSRGQEEASTQ